MNENLNPEQRLRNLPDLEGLNILCENLPGLVFLDVETARFADPGSIIEIGALILRPGQEPEVRHGMAYPGCLAEPRAQQVHGIDPEEYLEAESPRIVLEEVLGDLLDLPWVAHNSEFMEELAIRRWHPDWKPQWIDSLLISRLLQPTLSSHSLEALIQHYSLAETEKHRALEDAVDTARVLKAMVSELSSSLSREVLGEIAQDLASQYEGESRLLHSWKGFGSPQPQSHSVSIRNTPKGTGVSTVEEFFSEDGLGKVFPGYSPRCGQQEAAHHVLEILKGRRRAGLEAPTGTGKTLALLAAAAQVSLESEKPVIVSSLSRALQEQATDKDGPIIEKVMGVKISMLMGKDNYLCRHRAAQKLEVDDLSGPARGLIRSLLARDPRWIYSNLSFGIKKDARFDYDRWGSKLTARYGGCNPSARNHRHCGYSIACSEAESAQVIVMNHWVALNPPKNIPETAGLVFDEAHSLSGALQEFETYEFAGNRLKQDLPFLRQHCSESLCTDYAEYIDSIVELEQEWDRVHLDEAFDPITTDADADFWSGFREVVNELGKEVLAKIEMLRELAGKTKSKEARSRIYRSMESLLEYRHERWESLLQFLSLLQHYDDKSWIISRVDLRAFDHEYRATVAQPLFHNESFQRLTGRYPAVALVSATLGTASRPDHVLAEMGIYPSLNMEQPHLYVMDDPFPREEQLEVVVIRDIPGDRRSEAHQRAVSLVAHHSASTLGGRTLLFSSSRERANRYRNDLSESLLGSGVSLAPKSTQAAAAKLRADHPVIGIGCDGLGTGIDVPGEGLSSLVIESIPFPYHDAVIKTRQDHRETGYDAFLIDSLAPALIKLKQVAGRLLRSAEDRGVIFLVDPVVTDKVYADEVREALHPKKWTVVRYQDLERRVREICAPYSRYPKKDAG